MKTIIAGSRDILDPNLVRRAVEESGFTITEVVSGHARGVDTLGEKWARHHGIPIKLFIPKWRDKDGDYNPRAGFQRNQEMADYADAAVIVWDGQSNGTADMITRAKRAGLKVYIFQAGEFSRPVYTPAGAH